MRSSRAWPFIGAVAVIAVVWLAPVLVAGQATTATKAPATAKASATAAKPTTAAKPYSAKTPWGDPDLQGMWTTWDETPLQTPNPDPGAAAADRKRRAEFDGVDGKGTNEGLGGGMSRLHFSPVSARRQSLVVDPPNGRVPVKPEKVEFVPLRAMLDTWETHGAWSRCITRGVPGRLLQGGTGGYNKGYQILQIPGYVVIFPEEIHDARIIPLDGRPHVGKDIRLWNGDSRGRWDGQTLVVETTNFNHKGEGVGDVPTSEGLRVVERFTRVDATTINYEVTFEDPNVYTRSWTAMQPHNLDPKYIIYEYACHEGNTRYMEDSLTQGRIRDAEEAEAAAKKKTSNR